MQKFHGESNELFIIAENKKRNCLELILRKSPFSASEMSEIINYVYAIDKDYLSIRIGVVAKEEDMKEQLTNLLDNAHYSITFNELENTVAFQFKQASYSRYAEIMGLLIYAFELRETLPAPKLIMRICLPLKL